MSSLLSSDVKNSIATNFENVFDTFKKSITLHYDPVVSSTPSANHSTYYGARDAGKVKTPNKEVIDATVKFLSKQDVTVLNSDMAGSQIKIPLQNGSVRFRVKIANFDKVRAAKKVEYRSVRYEISSGWNLHGFSSDQFVDFYATPFEA